MKTEDQVRDEAKVILGFDEDSPDIKQGTGQITTFNQLGFKSVSDKPDGWYLPKDTAKTAIILEAKAEGMDLTKEQFAAELRKNVEIAGRRYKNVVGILYNGGETKVFKYTKKGKAWKLIDKGMATTLQHKNYYLKLFNYKVDKQKIYTLAKRINDCLHFKFVINDLKQRMIFTACTLVAKKRGAYIVQGMNYVALKATILSTLKTDLAEDLKKNLKLQYLYASYEKIDMNDTSDQGAVDDFLKWVTEISECVDADNWNGEDVMGIFFNEFNRYKTKSENGQVFTPDHITSFMYRLLEVNKEDNVLDATCGSGAFLVKAMCNMMKEAGGQDTVEAKDIKDKHLFGIEWDKEIFALACANMLIHNDGKTNLECMDAKSEEAKNWIKEKGITKVLMNPPYEKKSKCMEIVKNVLDAVPNGTKCAFIMPDKRLEKEMRDKKYGNKVLKEHTLLQIIKLPESLFFGVNIFTSIFVFEAHKPQNGKTIVGYYIEDDGLETVKNQGRQDIKDRWQELEDYWVQAIHDGEDTRFGTKQIINPAEHLSYQMPQKPFEVYEEDFMKTMMDYQLYLQGVDVKELADKLGKKQLYGSKRKS